MIILLLAAHISNSQYCDQFCHDFLQGYVFQWFVAVIEATEAAVEAAATLVTTAAIEDGEDQDVHEVLLRPCPLPEVPVEGVSRS